MRSTAFPLALIVLMCSLSSTTIACSGRFPVEDWRQFRVDQDQRERVFVKEVSERADLIFVGSVANGGGDPFKNPAQQAVFRVERLLKGKAEGIVTLGWSADRNEDATPQGDSQTLDKVEVSCWPPDDFDQLDFYQSEGYRYLVYAKDGKVLRASQFVVGPDYLSADEESEMISADDGK